MRTLLVAFSLASLILTPLGSTAANKTAFLFTPYRAAAQEEEEDLRPQDCVNPDEIVGEIRQSNDQLKEIKRLLKSKQASAEAKQTLSGLVTVISEHQKKFKPLRAKPCAEGVREILDEYREENYWEQISAIRRVIEIPQQLKQITRDLKDLDTLVARKSFITIFPALGGNLEGLRSTIAQRKEVVTQVAAALAKGGEALEEVDELMQPFWEGGHPGEILGVLNGLSTEFAQAWKKINDAEVKEALKSTLEPIISSVNEGEWMEAREAAQEIQPVMERIMRKLFTALRSKRGKSDLLKNLEQLEKKIEEKLGKPGEEEVETEGEE